MNKPLNLGVPTSHPSRAAQYRGADAWKIYAYDPETDTQGELLLEVMQQLICGQIAKGLAEGKMRLKETPHGYEPVDAEEGGLDVPDLLLVPNSDWIDEYPMRYYSRRFAGKQAPYRNPCGYRRHPNVQLCCTNPDGPWRKAGHWMPLNRQPRVCRHCFLKHGSPESSAHLSAYNKTRNPRNKKRKAANVHRNSDGRGPGPGRGAAGESRSGSAGS